MSAEVLTRAEHWRQLQGHPRNGTLEIDAGGSIWHTGDMPWWDIALGAGFVILALLVWLLKPQSRAAVPVHGQGTMDDVQRLVSEGQKISAIKIYRRIHGVGLKEAKEAVDAMSP